jgi:hypothetical protein
MERTIRSVTGRQWEVVDIGQVAGVRTHIVTKLTCSVQAGPGFAPLARRPC